MRNEDEPDVELSCRDCDWAETLDAAGVARRLRLAGRLRSQSEATPDELRQLALALAGNLACPACGHVGLEARLVHNETDGWLEAKKCDQCGKPMDPERLEALPNTTLCTACQQQAESAATAETGEYCPRCGAPLVVKPAAGRGLHRYELVCSGQPPCRSR